MASAYFEVAFFTGMRSEELIALRWCDIDWNDQTIRVERARTAGELKPLKTYNARDIDLVSRALSALQTMKPWTMMRGMEAAIFQNVETNKPLYDERSQRDHFWTPTLRRLGIRHRRAYQTRHTYATNSHWQQGQSGLHCPPDGAQERQNVLYGVCQVDQRRRPRPGKGKG